MKGREIGELGGRIGRFCSKFTALLAGGFGYHTDIVIAEAQLLSLDMVL